MITNVQERREALLNMLPPVAGMKCGTRESRRMLALALAGCPILALLLCPGISLPKTAGSVVSLKSRVPAAVVAAAPGPAPGNNTSFPPAALGNNSAVPPAAPGNNSLKFGAVVVTIVSGAAGTLLASLISNGFANLVVSTPPTAGAPETLAPKTLRQALRKSEEREAKLASKRATAVDQEEAFAKKTARKVIKIKEAAARANYEQGRLDERAAIEKAAVAEEIAVALEQGKAAVEKDEAG